MGVIHPQTLNVYCHCSIVSVDPPYIPPWTPTDLGNASPAMVTSEREREGGGNKKKKSNNNNKQQRRGRHKQLVVAVVDY